MDRSGIYLGTILRMTAIIGVGLVAAALSLLAGCEAPAPRPAIPAGAPLGAAAQARAPAQTVAPAEVEVLSRGENVALNKPAAMSSPYGDAVAGAAKGVDGNQNPAWLYTAANSIFLAGNGGKEWWEVDLGREHEVERVTLFQPDDGQARRLVPDPCAEAGPASDRGQRHGVDAAVRGRRRAPRS